LRAPFRCSNPGGNEALEKAEIKRLLNIGFADRVTQCTLAAAVAEAGMPVAELIRHVGISEHSLHWSRLRDL
jgi:hypothetical protein